MSRISGVRVPRAATPASRIEVGGFSGPVASEGPAGSSAHAARYTAPATTNAGKAAGAHLRNRRYAHSGTALRDIETLQTRYAKMWIAFQKTRALVFEAAARGDAGDPEALPFLLASKADAGETAIALAGDAMTICGGTAYRENSRLAQLLRDARASHVMAPTTDLLKTWVGRALLNLPLV